MGRLKAKWRTTGLKGIKCQKLKNSNSGQDTKKYDSSTDKDQKVILGPDMYVCIVIREYHFHLDPV